MVSEILKDANITPRQIDRISVCTGPGSFTGLRVALAFAKGFALPRNIPVIGLNALEVMAAQIDPHRENRVLSVMDVRRGQLCWGLYDSRQEVRAPVTQAIETAKAEITSLGYNRIVGDGAHYLGGKSQIETVSGPALAWISESRDPKDYPPIPLYSRPPDAKLPGGITPAHLTL